MKFHLKNFLIDLSFGIYNLITKPGPVTKRLSTREPMAALAESFDAVWVLTIPRNQARRDLISRQLEGLPFEFVQGVDGKSLLPDDPRINYPEAEARARRKLVINELACTLSHIEMYQRILREGLNRVLILEDDAVFVRNCAHWVAPILEQLPTDWELVYLGYRDGELRGLAHEFLKPWSRPSRDNFAVSHRVHRGLRTAAGHDFTHAYAVTLEGAKKLLVDALPVCQTADGLLEERVLAGRLRAYSTVPKLFIQLEDLGSSIHS